MTELVEVCPERAARGNVVGSHDVDVGERFVGGNRHHRDLRIQRGAHQSLVATVALRDDQSVDPAIINPLERDGRVVPVPQLQAEEHEAGIT